MMAAVRVDGDAPVKKEARGPVRHRKTGNWCSGFGEPIRRFSGQFAVASTLWFFFNLVPELFNPEKESRR
ncbi:hypothetical protein ACLB1S_30570 [Escherichia coli]